MVAGIEYTTTPLATEISCADKMAQYDEHVRKLLKDKRVLAHIMVNTIDEFKSYSVEDAMRAIADDIRMRNVSVDPAGKMSNDKPQEGFIMGDANEAEIPGEQTTFFDILFHAWLDNGESRKIYINIEAQKSSYLGYDLTTRGVIYASRVLSQQMGVEYTSKDYDGAKKVYSVWICMNPPGFTVDGKKVAETIVKYSLSPKLLYPADLSCEDIKIGRYDLISVIFINLGSTTADNELLGMLATLLSDKLSVSEKKAFVREEFFFTYDG